MYYDKEREYPIPANVTIPIPKKSVFQTFFLSVNNSNAVLICYSATLCACLLLRAGTTALLKDATNIQVIFGL